MKTYTVNYVFAADLFDTLEELWDVYSNSNPDASWGNNNLTLIAPQDIVDHLTDVVEIVGEELIKQFDLLKARVNGLADDVYVDLEA